MKIIQCAPIDIAVSKILKYAGTERIIDALNQSYSELGHDSIVAASGDSNLGGYGSLFVTRENSLWHTNGLERKMVRSDEAYENHFEKSLNLAFSQSADVLHAHPGKFLVDSDAYRKAISKIEFPIVTTIHEDISTDKLKLYENLKNLKERGFPVYFLGISNSHLNTYAGIGLNLDGFVYNGIPVEIFPFKEKKQDYLFWIGRVSDIKGTDLAVQIAKKSGRPLVIAGEVHDVYKKFYDEKVFPYLTWANDSGSVEDQEKKRNDLVSKLNVGKSIVDSGEIIFVGPLDDKQKAVFYSNASATLVPNRWKEPFGLIIVESMACGTPVLGTTFGAIPELIEDGKTGYLIEPPSNFLESPLGEIELTNEFAYFVNNLGSIYPSDCRKHVENKFSREIMSQTYLDFYKKVL